MVFFLNKKGLLSLLRGETINVPDGIHPTSTNVELDEAALGFVQENISITQDQDEKSS